MVRSVHTKSPNSKASATDEKDFKAPTESYDFDFNINTDKKHSNDQKSALDEVLTIAEEPRREEDAKVKVAYRQKGADSELYIG